MNPRYFILVVLALCIFVRCQEQSEETPEPTLAGVLDISSGRLYTTDTQKDSVLEALQALEIIDTLEREEQFYFTNLLDSTIYFAVDTTADLQVFELDLDGTAFSPEFWGIKVWAEAECNRNHPGFQAPCMRTFNRHRIFGNSMYWTVNNWQSCGGGTGYCFELLKKVGDIYYYPDFNCGDSSFVAQNLRRFRCD